MKLLLKLLAASGISALMAGCVSNLDPAASKARPQKVTMESFAGDYCANSYRTNSRIVPAHPVREHCNIADRINWQFDKKFDRGVVETFRIVVSGNDLVLSLLGNSQNQQQMQLVGGRDYQFKNGVMTFATKSISASSKSGDDTSFAIAGTGTTKWFLNEKGCLVVVVEARAHGVFMCIIPILVRTSALYTFDRLEK